MIKPEDIPIDSITPLQTWGISEEQLYVIRVMGLVDEPVITVPHPLEVADYLLLDGTHRAYVAYEDGLTKIPAYVLRTEEEFKTFPIAQHLGGLTLDGVYEKFRIKWQPALERVSIRRVRDLPVKDCSKEQLFNL